MQYFAYNIEEATSFTDEFWRLLQLYSFQPQLGLHPANLISFKTLKCLGRLLTTRSQSCLLYIDACRFLSTSYLHKKGENWFVYCSSMYKRIGCCSSFLRFRVSRLPRRQKRLPFVTPAATTNMQRC